MSQFASISNVNLHIYTLFILLAILVHNQQIVANSIHRENPHESKGLTLDDQDQLNMLFRRDSLFNGPVDDEISLSNSWLKKSRPSYIHTGPGISLRNGVIHLFPYKKRTIPLELQKAIYAHGIVGRRR